LVRLKIVATERWPLVTGDVTLLSSAGHRPGHAKLNYVCQLKLIE